MDERVLNQEYIKILFDETFIKTISFRTASPENNINLLRAYEIPIPKIEPSHWAFADVIKIVDRLKKISKNIDWNETILDGHTSEAISFMALLEAIAGKRRLNELAYLVFNEMYI